MTVTTVAISCDIGLADDAEFTAAQLDFTLSGPDYDADSNDTIPAHTVSVALDTDGVGVANLWPVDRGVNNTNYAVTVVGSYIRNGATTSKTFSLGRIRPPSTGAPFDLADLLAQESGGIIVGSIVYATIVDAVAAANQAAIDTAADAVATAADAVSTAADRVQTGLDRVAADASADAAASAAASIVAEDILPLEFASRPDLAAAISGGMTPINGVTYRANGVSYLGKTSATDIPDLPGLAPVGASAPISAWPITTAGHQAAWDYAHDTGTAIALDIDINVVGTEYIGNLVLVDAGGSINVIGDGDFAVSSGAGPWGDSSAILMRGANLNTDYGDPITTQYLVKTIGRIKVNHTRSHVDGPARAFRFSGLKDGSVLDLDVTAICSVSDETVDTVEMYFYNHCTLRGRYVVQTTGAAAYGLTSVRDINLGGLGPDYGSIIHLDDIYCENNNKDEALGIYTTGFPAGGAVGYLKVTGSARTKSMVGIAASILNNAFGDASEFDVQLAALSVDASGLIGGQPAFKNRSAASQIAALTITLRGAAAGITAGNTWAARYTDDAGAADPGQVGALKVIIDGSFDCGDGIIDLISGPVRVADAQTIVTSGSTAPRYAASNMLRGEIAGGDLISGTLGAAVNVWKITGGTVRGRLLNVGQVHDAVTVLWDTDDFGASLLENTGASAPAFPDKRVIFNPSIIASGTATPTRVMNVAWADATVEAGYVLDTTAAGGNPGGDDLATGGRVRYDPVIVRSGVATRKRPTLLAPNGVGNLSNVNTSAAGWVNIAHGMTGTPQAVFATIAGTTGRYTQIDYGNTDATNFRVYVFEAAGTPAASASVQIRWFSVLGGVTLQ